MIRRLACMGLLMFVGMTQASNVPNAAFAYSDTAVNNFAFDSTRIYVGGLFSQFVTGSVIDPRHRLAALNSATGAVLSTWVPTLLPDAIVSINTLVMSNNERTLFVGGDFSQFAGKARANIAAVDVQSGTVTLWNPDVDGIVRTMALSPDGTTVYIGGDFLNVGGQARKHLAALSTTVSQVTPWSVDSDLPVRTLAVAADGGALFVGGDFSNIAGQVRRHLARIDISSAQADAWQADTDASVRQLRISPDGADLYVAGDFTTVQSQARARLARMSTASPATLATWAPMTDAAVETLALSRDGEVAFVGGTFTSVDSIARSQLAAIDTATGAVEPWDPGQGGGNTITQVGALEISSDDATLFVGGDFNMIGGSVRSGMAVFNVAPPVTTLSPAAGGYGLAQSLTMSCVDNKGDPCSSIRYTTDGSDPRTSATAITYASTPINISAKSTTIRYSGTDIYGRDEAATTAKFYIDSRKPPIPALRWKAANTGSPRSQP